MEYHPLDFEEMVRLKNEAVQAAGDREISGLVLVKNLMGVSGALEGVGDPYRVNTVTDETVRQKADTTLAHRRSLSLLRGRIAELGSEGYSRDDFNQVGTLFNGGVAVFRDWTVKPKDLAGVIAFSGGKPDEDQSICRLAIYRARFYMDIAPLAFPTHIDDVDGGKCCIPSCQSEAESGFKISSDRDLEKVMTLISGKMRVDLNTNSLPSILVNSCGEHDAILESLQFNLDNYYQLIPEMIEESLKAS